MITFDLDLLEQMNRLRHLHLGGWRFERRYSPDPPHDLDELVYLFHHGEWLDVLRVHSGSTARAGRFLAESVIGGGCPQACWQAEGSLSNVLDRLDELPPPASRLSPRLILPTVVRTP
ncbi:MAG: hypothetical protein ABIQ18_15660 [Umezawaea sp.]